MASKQTMYNLLVGTTKLEFPDVYIQYSEYMQNIQGINMNNGGDENGSGREDEDEEPGIPNVTESFNIELKNASEQDALALVELLNIHYDPTYSNKTSEIKKVSDDKFKIKEALGGNTKGDSTIEIFEKMGSTGVLSLAKLAGYLDIELVKHLCYTWICHNLYTIKTTREKMNWIGIPDSVKEPDCETVIGINLDTGDIPNKDTNTSSSPVTNETDGGAGK